MGNLKKSSVAGEATTIKDGIFEMLADKSLKINTKAIKNYKVEWYIDNFLLKQSLVMIYGAPGSGKSIFSLYLANHLLESKKAKSIIYLDADNGFATLKARRLDAFLDKHGDDLLYLACNTPSRFSLFEEMCEAGDIEGKFLIIDSIRNFINFDFTKDDKMTIFLSHLQTLRDKGSSIIFLHHQPKQIEGENNKAYKGATAFLDSVDEAYYLSNHSNTYSKNGNIIVSLDPQKMRDDTKAHSFILDTKTLSLQIGDYDFLGLNKRELITLQLAMNIINESGDAGIKQSEFVKKIQKYAKMNYLDIVAKNALWELLNRYTNKLFIVERASGFGQNSKIFRPLNNAEIFSFYDI